ncbi:MAG: hypothetical protein WCC17_04930 [Candidatus Nitrosopolaris sp.]|jgi:hypothetical protein
MTGSLGNGWPLAKKLNKFNDYILLYPLMIEDDMKLTREHIFILAVIAATLIIIEVVPYLIPH